jgi:hypothetical protein
VHEAVDAVARCEALHCAFAVLDESSFEVVGYSDVKVARAAREDVYAERAGHERDSAAELYAGRRKKEKERKNKKEKEVRSRSLVRTSSVGMTAWGKGERRRRKTKAAGLKGRRYIGKRAGRMPALQNAEEAGGWLTFRSAAFAEHTK